MSFFKKKRKDTISTNIKVEDVYVIKALIVSNYNDGNDFGVECVEMYFLAKCKDNEYYELFSGKKLETNEKHLFQYMNIPYVEEVKHLSKYCNKVKIDSEALFDFITRMNALNMLKAFPRDI